MPSNSLRILSTGMGWPSAQPGGLNTYFQNITERLSERHVVQALVCSQEEPVVKPGLLVENIADPKLSLRRRRIVFGEYAARQMEGQKFDLVYTHFAPYGLGVAMEAKKRNIPVVMAFHGPWSEEIKVEGGGMRERLKRWVAKSIEMKAYRLADAFIVLSETFRDILHKHYQVPLDKIHIVAGAADTVRFQPSADRTAVRLRLGLAPHQTAVLTVRRLVNRMGLMQLLAAWKEVAGQAQDAVLLIGGRGPLKGELESRIAEYGLQDRVRLLGYIPDGELAGVYQAADLFVVPTQSLEGFGLITVEAMASGVPVMATPIGGSREILSKFNPAMLFKSANSGDMAAGLIHMLKHREQWPSPEQCRNHVLDHYTWDLVTAQVEAVFEQAMGRKIQAFMVKDRDAGGLRVRRGGADTDVESSLH